MILLPKNINVSYQNNTCEKATCTNRRHFFSFLTYTIEVVINSMGCTRTLILIKLLLFLMFVLVIDLKKYLIRCFVIINTSFFCYLCSIGHKNIHWHVKTTYRNNYNYHDNDTNL